MFDRIRNGWELMKASARALAADRELLVFPIVSTIATLAVMASFVLPIVMTEAWRAVEDDTGSSRAVAGVVAWLFYFATSIVTIYFNTALVGAALIRLEGGDPTVSDGIRIANSRLTSILGYAAISATVGLLLKAAQRRSGRIGQWIIALVGVGWSLATFLVIPVLAATGLGPIDAVKRSAQLFRKTWGETIAGTGSISIITGLVSFGLILLGVGATILAAQTGSMVVIGIVVGVFVLAILVVALLGSALQGVFTAALYRFATTGEGGFGFETSRLAGAFRSKAAA